MREREREEKKKEEIELEKFLYFGKFLDLVICVSFWFIFHFFLVYVGRDFDLGKNKVYGGLVNCLVN